MGVKCSMLLCLMQVFVFGKQLNLTQEALDAREQHRQAKKALKHDRTRKGVDVNGVRVGKIEENTNLLQNKGIPKNVVMKQNNVQGSTTIRGEAASTSSKRIVNPIITPPKLFLKRNDPTLAPTYPPIKPSHVTSQCIERVNGSATSGYRIPVFWINLDASAARRQYFSAQMEQMGMSHKRIPAITPDSILTKEAKIDIEPKVPHTHKEISCVISHLLAIREAIYDTTLDPSNPFALITEDDVSFEMNVNFQLLAASAPVPFAGLQLMSSADNEIKRLWQSYKSNPVPSNLWEQRKLESFFWSAQAYMINKTALKPLIDMVFYSTKQPAATAGGVKTTTTTTTTTTSTSYDHHRIRIINPYNAFPCDFKQQGKCYFPMRLVSDTYIYALCFPTYVTKIPLFNGAPVGENTTIHMRKNNDITHAKAFFEIAKVLAEVRSFPQLLPPHIHIKKCDEHQ